MRILSYDEVDPYEVYRLGMVAFNWPITPKYVKHRLQRDPRVLDGFAIYAVEGGKVVSQVVPLKMRVRLTTGEETVGGIQGVCTDPDMWGKGYARRLMVRSHEIYRELSIRISTLTTSRNIRGHGIYAKLGYTDLPPFFQATRLLPTEREGPQGLHIRSVREKDLSAIQGFYEVHTSDQFGWSLRDPGLLRMKVAWDRKTLDPYRIVTRDNTDIGYVRAPGQGVLTDEIVIPRAEDFKDTLRALEKDARGDYACVSSVSTGRDLERLVALGYTPSSSMMGKVMALSLSSGLKTKELPQLFGSKDGRFVFYPTDGF